MRMLTTLLPASALVAAATVATLERPSHTQPQTELRSYVVRVTEYQVDTSTGVGLTGDELVGAVDRLQAEGRIELIRTVNLSIVEGIEGQAQFSEELPIVSEVSTNDAGEVARSVNWKSFGVIVYATVRRDPSGTVLELTYDAARLKGTDDNGVSLGSALTRIVTSLIMEPNAPQVLAGVSEDNSRFVLVTLEE